jgi:hypothetical protein
MKNFKRTLLYAGAGTVLFASVAGGIALRAAQQQYYGVCSQLDGIPGLLQRAGFFQAGTCSTPTGGKLCNAGGSCTVNGSAGTCANKGKPGGSPVCICVAKITPPD